MGALARYHRRVSDLPPVPPTPSPILPEPFARWFFSRGWAPREHQLALLAAARAGRSALLIAPTGAGKTLAGFLPTLVELFEGRSGAKGDRARGLFGTSERAGGLHTLYVSPLKALAVDIARNLERPVAEMGLPIRIETRTGDTPQSRRARQRRDPPDILLTTPEQLALLLASADAPYLFGSLRRVVLDELHALVTSKRGDLLSLGLARLFATAPNLTTVGLSATVADPEELARFLVPQRPGETCGADIVQAAAGAAPIVEMLDTAEHLPWSGHSAAHALAEIYELIGRHKTTLVFVNTRSQAEFLFQALWRINDDNHAIALHHGSLDVAQRRKVEAAMAEGRLRAVVCTSSLDLGIDWGDVDLVINVGAPKGASRLIQRIGRANHRLDEPSRAVLVPANRFEVLECRAAVDAVAENAQDTPPLRTGALDVLAQHVLGCACGAPFLSDDLFDEVRAAAPYAELTRENFDATVDFVATGGYALKAYERFAKIRKGQDGRWRVTHPRIAQRYRLNVGTIVEEPMIKIRLVRARGAATRGPAGAIGRAGKLLGEVEEYFIEGLVPGDTFLFAGEVLRYEVMAEDSAYVSRATAEDPKVPVYAGGKFPLSTYLAARVRDILATPTTWRRLPDQVHDWLDLQRRRSRLPKPGELLVETFPRADKHYLVCYPFEGRLAHQTLGMLLTRRLERAHQRPLGFVANEYALAVWGLGDLSFAVKRGALSLDALFDQDMLGDDLEAWLAESALMKRTFRQCAVIAGLIERRSGGEEKSRRQVTISTDLVYDVLRKHQPDHMLLRAARAEAATGLLDIRRLGLLLSRVRGRIVHEPLPRVSPLAVPVMLEIGRERVAGEASESLLAEAEADLVREAMG
ncbi:MAG: ligase-associated DNA damage response DEXH box helicase [Rhodoplanes sp.]|uniref:ligase-associated DNA damage response DEXH box helicase n=1 Tax=Rhodoplanes sp. TaxID=1968906 RepID=UPI0018412DB6|nr:ligase-associated DNA damage response DEXH box helicase [Rhodoplanes sp.]NVO12855.1 ligase-associated DNA damage response DEXH box helicase [Rhodoplanes sp.]